MTILADYINAEQARGTLPGLVLASQYGFAPVQIHAWGVDGAGIPLAEASVFPVASITKLALSLAIHRLVDRGNIALHDPIGAYIPDIHPLSASRSITSLLAHTSGFGFDLPNKEGRYAHGLTWPALARECLETPPEAESDVRVQYSNLGYGILGVLLERVTQRTCAEALVDLVIRPLGIHAWLGDNPDVKCAVIGDVRGRHRGTDLETYNSPFWRSLALPWGGLCTDAHGALSIVHAFSSQSDLLSPARRSDATSDYTHQLAGGFMRPLMWEHSPWGLGPELRGTKQPHWVANTFPPDSFGHSGASGMLTWYDPHSMFGFALLGARAADSGWLLRHAPEISRRLRESHGL
ncbi:MAG: serine hydrolase domain-containing protein [Chloroflexota bacterium]|jgi:beta-lactamase class C